MVTSLPPPCSWKSKEGVVFGDYEPLSKRSELAVLFRKKLLFSEGRSGWVHKVTRNLISENWEGELSFCKRVLCIRLATGTLTSPTGIPRLLKFTESPRLIMILHTITPSNTAQDSAQHALVRGVGTTKARNVIARYEYRNGLTFIGTMFLFMINEKHYYTFGRMSRGVLTWAWYALWFFCVWWLLVVGNGYPMGLHEISEDHSGGEAYISRHVQRFFMLTLQGVFCRFLDNVSHPTIRKLQCIWRLWVYLERLTYCACSMKCLRMWIHILLVRHQSTLLSACYGRTVRHV